MRAIFLTVAAVCPLIAASEWTRLTSSNFEMYTTAGGRDPRRTLEYFEQVRDFFMRIKSQQTTTRLPVTIVVFKNAKEYKPYTMSEHAVAYFTGDEQRDYIVMSGAGQENYATAVHEYMHLLVRHSGLKLPVWLNEGIAEVYSTLKPTAGEVLIGSIPQGRAYSLNQFKWIPLSTLIRVKHDSPEFDEKNRVGVLYAQSWMLTHMLMLGEAYADNFGRFAVEVSSSGSAEQAFEKIYGKTLENVDKDLQRYYGSQLRAIVFKTKLQRIEVSEPVAANEFDTELTLTKLVALLDRNKDAETRYQSLAKTYPDRWEVHEAMAHLYWRGRDHDKAKASFRRAVAANPPNWKTYWDFARLAKGEDGTMDAMRKALKLNPSAGDVRLALGYELYLIRQFDEAWQVLAGITQITPDRATSLFLVKAYSALESGRKPQAKASAELALKYAKTATDIADANRLLTYLDRPHSPEISPQEMPASPAPKPAGHSSLLTGALQEIECLKKEARIHISSGSNVISLLIRDPDRVTLKNSDSSTVNLTCGPQKNTRVTVEFRPKDDAEYKTLGDVITLEFIKAAAQ